MRDLIYIPLDRLALYDPYLRDESYEYNGWFNTMGIDHFPPMIQSRVNKLNTPWDLAPTLCPIPAITNNELRFDVVIETVAEAFCQRIKQTGRKPYFCWSGGIDSTSILVSMLKVADSDVLDRITVLCDPVLSVGENAYFYYNFIKPRLQVEDITDFVIDASNYNKILVVDGEAGNQCMGSTPIHKLAYKKQFDLLNSPWSQVDPKDMIARQTSTSIFETTLNGLYFTVDLVKETIKYSPIPIETVYDFLWWINFNLKLDDVLLRKILNYAKNLNQQEFKDFYENTLYRFYAADELQIWSMLSKDLRRERTVEDPKYFPKKYIFDFDGNDLYWSNKREEKSMSRLYSDVQADIFAIDKDWRRYSLEDTPTRQELGRILKRTT